MLITDRDRDILVAIWRHRLLEVSQLEHRFFSHDRLCRRRMAKLYQAGLVERFVRPTTNTGRSPFIYHLSARGLRELGHPVRGRYFLSTVKSSLFLDHSLLTSQFLLSLELAAQDTAYRIKFLTEAECRSRLSRQQHGLIPDAVLSFEAPDGNCSLAFLEVDMGTEPLRSRRSERSTVWGKLSAYAEQLSRKTFFNPEFSGRPYPYRGFRVLLLVPSEERLNNILALAKELPHGTIFWVTTREQLAAEQLLFAPIWQTTTSREPQPLIRGQHQPDTTSQAGPEPRPHIGLPASALPTPDERVPNAPITTIF